MERVDSNYRKAFVEVDAVLNCLNTNAYNKIPLNVINAIRDNKDENYQYEYDEKIEYYKWNFRLLLNDSWRGLKCATIELTR